MLLDYRSALFIISVANLSVLLELRSLLVELQYGHLQSQETQDRYSIQNARVVISDLDVLSSAS